MYPLYYWRARRSVLKSGKGRRWFRKSIAARFFGLFSKFCDKEPWRVSWRYSNGTKQSQIFFLWYSIQEWYIVVYFFKYVGQEKKRHMVLFTTYTTDILITIYACMPLCNSLIWCLMRQPIQPKIEVQIILYPCVLLLAICEPQYFQC